MRKFIINLLPTPLLNYIIKLRVPKWKGDQRIFCISFQRTGTTSFGDLFEHLGYPRAGYKVGSRNQWTRKHFNGKDEDIFNSPEFNRYQVFEDDPWWLPGFFKKIYKRFPDSKFVLIERDSKEWFQSMINHSDGKTLGNTRIHVHIYDRVEEFNERLKNNPNFSQLDKGSDNLLELEGFEEHYIRIYENHITDVKKFFEDKTDSLCVINLKDPEKWQILSKFIGFEIPKDFEVHANNSKLK